MGTRRGPVGAQGGVGRQGLTTAHVQGLLLIVEHTEAREALIDFS